MASLPPSVDELLQDLRRSHGVVLGEGHGRGAFEVRLQPLACRHRWAARLARRFFTTSYSIPAPRKGPAQPGDGVHVEAVKVGEKDRLGLRPSSVPGG